MKLSLKKTGLAIGLALSISGMTNAGGLPDPGVTFTKGNTAVVITDPQNDFLSPDGVTWGVVGQSVTENNTVTNLDSLFKTAKAQDIPVFVSPHYYYPHDHEWDHGGALENADAQHRYV